MEEGNRYISQWCVSLDLKIGALSLKKFETLIFFQENYKVPPKQTRSANPPLANDERNSHHSLLVKVARGVFRFGVAETTLDL